MDVGMNVYECMPAGFFTLYAPTHCEGFFLGQFRSNLIPRILMAGSTESGL